MAAIIFDFDGTIVDNRDYFVEFIAKEAKRWPLSDQDKLAIAGQPLLVIATRLGIDWYKLPKLYFKGRSKMDRAISSLKVFDGIPDLVKKLHSEGHVLFILSSNSLRNIRLFLKHYEMRQYFMEVYAGVAIFGKAGMLHKLLRDNNLKAAQATMVGDEVRDIVAAQAVGVKSVAVAWGLSSYADLVAMKPTAVVSSVSELLAILEET